MATGTKEKKKVIIKKKSGGHGHGHHGGSWKVAYADFVTAMMAFFLVMWIVGMDDKAKNSIEGYFSNPVGFKKGFGSGASPMGSGNTPTNGVPNMRGRSPARQAEEAAMEATRQRLIEAMAQEQLAGLSGHVDVAMTHEGLRIEFGEGLAGDATFASGSAAPTDAMLRAFAILGAEIAPLPNSVVIEGHTDAVPLRRPGGYSNWELSADRANSARRALQDYGVAPDRIAAVRGYADRNLKIPDFPADPRNRRITILLPFRTAEYLSSEAEAPAEDGGAAQPPAADSGATPPSAAPPAPAGGSPPPGATGW